MNVPQVKSAAEREPSASADASERTYHGWKSLLLAVAAIAIAALIYFLASLVLSDWPGDLTWEAVVVVEWSVLAIELALGLLLTLGIAHALRAFRTRRESRIIASLGLIANALLAVPIAALVALAMVNYFLRPYVDGTFLINDQPAGEAELYLWDMSTHPNYRNGISSSTRRDGTFRIYGLWRANYELQIHYELPAGEDPPFCREPSGDYKLNRTLREASGVVELKITAREPLKVRSITRIPSPYFINLVCE